MTNNEYQERLIDSAARLLMERQDIDAHDAYQAVMQRLAMDGALQDAAKSIQAQEMKEGADRYHSHGSLAKQISDIEKGKVVQR